MQILSFFHISDSALRIKIQVGFFIGYQKNYLLPPSHNTTAARVDAMLSKYELAPPTRHVTVSRRFRRPHRFLFIFKTTFPILETRTFYIASYRSSGNIFAASGDHETLKQWKNWLQLIHLIQKRYLNATQLLEQCFKYLLLLFHFDKRIVLEINKS